MKIAMTGGTLANQGSEYVIASLARGLSKHGHDVTLILSKYYDDWRALHPEVKQFDLEDNVRVIVLPTCRMRESVLPLRKVLMTNDFDVILDQTGNLAYSMIASGIFMKNRPAMIHVEHLWIGVNLEGKQIEPRNTFKGHLLNWILRRLDAQFVVSRGMVNAMVRMTGYPRERIYTVYNPVIDDVFERKREGSPSHPWLREDASIPVVVAAGAFIPVKNHLLLLRAWSEVVTKFKARLIIFGDGSLRGEYESLIKDLGVDGSVSLPGFTNNLPAELKKSSCFVVSSFVETFSIVLVEALACGIPVVSTDCPYGPGEILQNGQYGILVKNNDVSALAEGILKVLRGEHIKPPPESYAPFTIEAVVNRYESAMDDVLSKRKVTL